VYLKYCLSKSSVIILVTLLLFLVSGLVYDSLSAIELFSSSNSYLLRSIFEDFRLE
jgi:hypothetical protein